MLIEALGEYQILEPPSMINGMINFIYIFSSGQLGQLFGIYGVILLACFA
jgi:hypothetical protein